MFTAFELFSDEQGQAEMYPGAMVFCLSRLHAGGRENDWVQGSSEIPGQSLQDLVGSGAVIRRFADVKPTYRSPFIQEDRGGAGYKAESRMAIPDSQLWDRLPGVVAQEDDGWVQLLGVGRPLRFDPILVFHIAAKLSQQIGVICADPDDLSLSVLKLRQFRPQGYELLLAVGAPVPPIEDQGRLVRLFQQGR